MQVSDLNARVSRKVSLFVVFGTILFVLIAMIALGAGYEAYLENQQALITNYDTMFKANSPLMLTYVYEDGTQSVDLANLIRVSKNATFSVTKIIEEDKSVVPYSNTVIDLSERPLCAAGVRVKSGSGKKITDYIISLVSKSQQHNELKFEGALLDNQTLYYSGTSALTLPTPVKTVTAADGATGNFDFLGWYTTENFAEGTEITEVPIGSSGELTVYAKFRTATRIDDRRIAIGEYPQTRVKEYALLQNLRTVADSYGNRTTFNYAGEKYYKFKPDNVANLAENGYSSSTYYYFKVEPIVWCQTLPQIVEGTNYYLIAEKVLNCSAYGGKGTTDTLYNLIPENIRDSVTDNAQFIINYFYGADTLWERSDIREKMIAEFDSATVFGSDYAKLVAQGRTKYTQVGTTDSYTDKVFAPSMTEALTSEWGFSGAKDYDALRRVEASDFAQANGAYVSKNTGHKGLASWWLRGVGTEFEAADKRIAYVKYTGQIHSYTAINYSVRSGMRPMICYEF